jgi:uncharacterized protein with beta-barrel porin domain
MIAFFVFMQCTYLLLCFHPVLLLMHLFFIMLLSCLIINTRTISIMTSPSTAKIITPGKTRLSMAIALACATLATAPLFTTQARADSCNAASTTISAASTDQCKLEAGESVLVTSTGSINTSGISILVDNVTAGNIVNSGTITSDTQNGISVDSSTINGGITNSGTINGDSGIYVRNNSTITGDITNSGTINSDDEAIRVDSSTINGGITNSGTITADTGIYVGNSAITGDITNSGTINAATGIEVRNSATITGGITNSGTINADSFGILARNSTINGSITNSGTINAGEYGMDIGNSVVGDGIINSGTINGDTYGIYLRAGNSITGGITNSGTINTDDEAIRVDSSTITGGINNSGTINADNDGIYVDDSTITGGITNSGTINVASGTGIYVSNDSTVNGGLTNTGSIIVGTGAAIDYQASNSVLNNSGTISGPNAILAGDGITLNVLAGSTILGAIDLDSSTTDTSDTVNIYGGNTSAISTFVGADTINIYGAGTQNGDTVTTVDPTGGSAQTVVLSGISTSIHNVVSQRMMHTTPLKPVQLASLELSPGMLFQQRQPVAWAQAFGGRFDRDAEGNALAYDSNHVGFALGYEWDVNQTRLGFMGGFVNSNTESQRNSFNTNTKSYYLGAYSHANLGAVNLTASLLGGYGDYDNDRVVIDNINGVEVARSDFDSLFISPSLTLSSAYTVDDRLELRPSASINYSVAWLDSYTESGTTRSNLSIDDRTARVLTARIQLAAAYKFDQSSEFEFRVGMNSRHTNDEDTQVTLAGNNFTYSSVGDDSVSGGFAGINLRVADSGNLSFVADAEVGGNNNENYIAGNLSLEYSF